MPATLGLSYEDYFEVDLRDFCWSQSVIAARVVHARSANIMGRQQAQHIQC